MSAEVVNLEAARKRRRLFDEVQKRLAKMSIVEQIYLGEVFHSMYTAHNTKHWRDSVCEGFLHAYGYADEVPPTLGERIGAFWRRTIEAIRRKG